jgi:hypothetical protein
MMHETRTGGSANLADPAELASWDCGSESRLKHGYLSLWNVVCCQVEIFATADPSSIGALPRV